MDDKLRSELALFRFSLIAPILNQTITGSVKDYLESICARPYQIPGLGFRELSPKTVKHWLLDYRRHGLEGLKRKSRNEKGLLAALTAKLWDEE